MGAAECTPVEIYTSEACAAFLALNATGFEDLSEATLAEVFPYLVSQDKFDATFRAENAQQCFEDFVRGTTGALPLVLTASPTQ